MAVTDLWHVKGGARCPECRTKAGAPSTRHGRGARWRVTVGDHPSRAFAVKADAEDWEASLKLNPWAGPGSTVGGAGSVVRGDAGTSPGGLEQCRRAVNRVRPQWGARRDWTSTGPADSGSLSTREVIPVPGTVGARNTT